ncbi:hypothetical protein [Parasphingopyxis lamellibrachiae]|uniref:Uncharacterized protein n=1 Tax=Parasphingopyxis lamellibrachiae TaxID=680125 RepID=A0A3D9FIX6_9SPHN|nr:hypothetical protein [Parasphingopyxis lamellibrachiae]RED17749.1 hypothetical protein DFR46_2803 [Parasphingopyxis lamellibrachiae]
MKAGSLFLWAMLGVSSAASAQSADVTIPDAIAFGASVDSMTERLAGLCSEAELRTIDPPVLPDVQNIQQQIDCQGFDYMGEPRLAEFVFRDDALQMVWILVDADDQERIVAAMREAYGEDGLTTSDVVAFREHRTAWRFEPPEVLFFSEELRPAMERFLTAPTE